MNSEAHHFQNAAKNGASNLASVRPQSGRTNAPLNLAEQADTSAIMGMLQDLLHE